jgi:hypothetical protein
VELSEQDLRWLLRHRDRCRRKGGLLAAAARAYKPELWRIALWLQLLPDSMPARTIRRLIPHLRFGVTPKFPNQRVRDLFDETLNDAPEWVHPSLVLDPGVLVEDVVNTRRALALALRTAPLPGRPEGRTLREIADIMGVSIECISDLLRKAKEPA